MGFTKLYTGILESTLWCESDRTRLVWVTMLAMADEFGRVLGSVPGLANRARVPVEDTRAALVTFLAPDPDSRTPDYEGRRVEIIDGGWRLLNHAKYRELRSEDDRREQNRQAQRRMRERKKAAKASATVSTRHLESAESAHTEAYANADADLSSSSSKKTPPCPVQDLIKQFVEAVPELPKPRPEMWAKSKAADAMRARWSWILRERREDGERYATTSDEALAWFAKFFARVGASDFLTGRNGAWTKCDLGWLMQPENFRKVVEGNYMERQPA